MPLPLLAIAAGGMAMGGLGSYLGARSQAKAARGVQSAMQRAMAPVPLSTGFGSVGMQGGQLTSQLAGPYAQMQQLLAGQLNPQNVGLSPEAAAMRSSMYDMAPGMFTQASDLMGMAVPSEMYGSGSFALNMPTTDIGQTAQQQMALMQQLVQPAREQAMASREAQLLARGMLSSGTGAQAVSDLEQANRMQDVQMAQQALGEARAQRGMELGEAQAQQQAAMAGAGMGLQQQGMLGGLAQQLFGQGMMSQEAGMGYDRFLAQLQQQEMARQGQVQQGLMGLAGLESNLMGMSRAATAQNLHAQGMMSPYMMMQGQNPFAAMLGGAGQGVFNAALTKMMG